MVTYRAMGVLHQVSLQPLSSLPRHPQILGAARGAVCPLRMAFRRAPRRSNVAEPAARYTPEKSCALGHP